MTERHLEPDTTVKKKSIMMRKIGASPIFRIRVETKYNFNVLQCVYNSKYLDISDSELKALEQAHFRKIELSDAIYVLDINGYVGEQVTKEIAYAKGLGKEIFYNSTFAKGYTN